MRIGKKAKAYLDETYGMYTENDKLELFDILHLHDTGKCAIAKNDGYHDSRHFEVIGYNLKLRQSRKLGRHDSLNFTGDTSPVDMIRIFLDGSTMVKFKKPTAFIHNTQAIYHEFSKE